MEFLPYFWALVLAFAIILYVILDGFDLGIGILFGFQPDEDKRNMMMGSIGPVWDGNETWLIVVGATLYAAFPVVYAIITPAFYLPLLLLVVGLILRGVAFEFRYKTVSMRGFWDWGFIIGSGLAAFVQGAAVGALVDGLPVRDQAFVGGPIEWLMPFPVLCGIGLMVGYALLGATWLVLKTEGDLRDWARQQVFRLLIAVHVFLIIAFAYSIFSEFAFMERWLTDMRLWIFPVIGLVALVLYYRGLTTDSDSLPFWATVLMFLSAFGVLAVTFWPNMVPSSFPGESITILNAAAPPNSLEFIFWGAGVFMLPITFVYTLAAYWIFRGKVKAGDAYH